MPAVAVDLALSYLPVLLMPASPEFARPWKFLDWEVSRGECVALLVVLLAFEGFAAWALDEDFFLPDPFRWIVLYLVVLFLVTGLLRSFRMRVIVRLAAGILPALAVLGFEAAYVASDPGPASETIERTPDDPLLRYRWRAGVQRIGDLDRAGNTFLINRQGLIDEEYPLAKPPDVFRIVFVGDSVPNDKAIPFAKRLPKQLEADLNQFAPAGRRVEVINVSCPGYNSIQEVRFLEKVGLKYQPDLVLFSYVLNDPFLQNGGYHRIGNSFFLFRLLPQWLKLTRGSTCPMFRWLHEGYGFDLVVRSSFERLKLLAQLHGFAVVVALVPIVESFDDPDCIFCYDRAATAAADQGFEVIRLVEELPERDYRHYLKPGSRFDVTHPNEAGHIDLAAILTRHVGPRVAAVFGNQ